MVEAEDKLRALKRDLELRRAKALSNLLQAAAESSDPVVRALWNEHRTVESILAELTRKKEPDDT